MHLYYCVQTSASVIQNSEVVRYSGAAIVLYYLETSVGAYSSVRYLVDVRYWECPLIESSLYYYTCIWQKQVFKGIVKMENIPTSYKHFS